MKLVRAVPVLAGVACFTLLAAASSAPAQSADGNRMSGGNASAADKMFVKKAMAGGMAEVELGQLAAQKASSDDVKQFGQKMVEDHSRLNDQMKPIAGELGVSPPSSIPPAEKALETRLKGLSGEAFDKAYMQAMVKDHRQDLMEFKKEASAGQSSAVKDAASQGQQVISEHLQMAQDIARKVGVGSAAMAGNGQS